MNKKLLLWSIEVTHGGFLSDIDSPVIAASSSKNSGKPAASFQFSIGSIISYLSNHLFQANGEVN